MEAIEMFGEEVPNAVKLLAAKYLKDINGYFTQLDEHRSKLFHSLTTTFTIFNKNSIS